MFLIYINGQRSRHLPWFGVRKSFSISEQLKASDPVYTITLPLKGARCIRWSEPVYLNLGGLLEDFDNFYTGPWMGITREEEKKKE